MFLIPSVFPSCHLHFDSGRERCERLNRGRLFWSKRQVDVVSYWSRQHHTTPWRSYRLPYSSRKACHSCRPRCIHAQHAVGPGKCTVGGGASGRLAPPVQHEHAAATPHVDISRSIKSAWTARDLQQVLTEHSHELGPDELTQAFYCAQFLIKRSDPTTTHGLLQQLQQLATSALDDLDSFRPKHYAQLLTGFCKLGLHPGADWLQTFLSAAQPHLHSFNCQDLANTLHSLGHLKHQPDAAWTTHYQAASAPKLQWFEPRQLAATLHGWASLRQLPESSWLQAYEAAVLQQLPKYTSWEVSSTLWAFATLSKTKGDLLGGITAHHHGSAAQAPVDDLSNGVGAQHSSQHAGTADFPLDTAAAQHRTAEFQKDPSAAQRRAQPCGTAALAALAAAQAASFTPQGLANTLHSLAVLQHDCFDQHIPVLVRACLRRAGEFKQQELGSVLWALARLRVALPDQDMQLLLDVVSRKANSFSCLEACIVLLSISSLHCAFMAAHDQATWPTSFEWLRDVLLQRVSATMPTAAARHLLLPLWVLKALDVQAPDSFYQLHSSCLQAKLGQLTAAEAADAVWYAAQLHQALPAPLLMGLLGQVLDGGIHDLADAGICRLAGGVAEMMQLHQQQAGSHPAAGKDGPSSQHGTQPVDSIYGGSSSNSSSRSWDASSNHNSAASSSDLSGIASTDHTGSSSSSRAGSSTASSSESDGSSRNGIGSHSIITNGASQPSGPGRNGLLHDAGPASTSGSAPHLSHTGAGRGCPGTSASPRSSAVSSVSNINSVFRSVAPEAGRGSPSVSASSRGPARAQPVHHSTNDVLASCRVALDASLGVLLGRGQRLAPVDAAYAVVAVARAGPDVAAIWAPRLWRVVETAAPRMLPQELTSCMHAVVRLESYCQDCRCPEPAWHSLMAAAAAQLPHMTAQQLAAVLYCLAAAARRGAVARISSPVGRSAAETNEQERSVNDQEGFGNDQERLGNGQEHFGNDQERVRNGSGQAAGPSSSNGSSTSVSVPDTRIAMTVMELAHEVVDALSNSLLGKGALGMARTRTATQMSAAGDGGESDMCTTAYQARTADSGMGEGNTPLHRAHSGNAVIAGGGVSLDMHRYNTAQSNDQVRSTEPCVGLANAVGNGGKRSGTADHMLVSDADNAAGDGDGRDSMHGTQQVGTAQHSNGTRQAGTHASGTAAAPEQPNMAQPATGFAGSGSSRTTVAAGLPQTTQLMPSRALPVRSAILAVYALARLGITDPPELVGALLEQLSLEDPRLPISFHACVLWSAGRLAAQVPGSWWAQQEAVLDRHMCDYSIDELANVVAGMSHAPHGVSRGLSERMWAAAEQQLQGTCSTHDACILGVALAAGGVSLDPRRLDFNRLAAALQPSSSWNAAHLAHVMYTLAKLNCPPGAEWMAVYVREAEEHLGQLTPKGVAMMLWGLSRLSQQVPASFLSLLVSVVEEKLPASSPHELATIIHACYAMGHPVPPQLLSAAEKHVGSCLHEASPEALVQVLASFASARHQPSKPWLAAYLQASSAQHSWYTTSQLARLSSAISRLKLRPPQEWLSTFYSAVQQRSSDATPQETAVISSFLSKLGSSADSQRTLAALLRCTQDRLGSFSPQGLSMLLAAVARLRVSPSPEWMQNFMAAALHHMDASTPQALASILFSLTHLRFHPDAAYLQAHLAASHRQMHRFSPRDLSITIWSLSRLGVLPSKRWLLAFQEAARKQLARFRGRDLLGVISGMVVLGWTPGAAWVERLRGAVGEAKGKGFLEDPEEAAHVHRALGMLGPQAQPAPMLWVALDNSQ